MTEPLTHLVFDTETLGTRTNAVVLAIAVVPFQFEVVRPFEEYILSGTMVKLNPVEQIKKGRKVEKSTVDWWETQPEDVRQITRPSPEDFSLEDGLATIKSFVLKSGYNFKESYVWSRGSYFDFPLIESLCDSVGKMTPYNGWKIRDTRTLFDVLSGGNRGEYNGVATPDSFRKHDCLHDAALDAYKMVDVFQREFSGE